MARRHQSPRDLEALTPTTYSMWSFYRPHARSTFDNEVIHPFTGEISHPPSMTKQEFKDQCDINNIIKAFKITGQINHMSANAQLGMYADLPDPIDYQDAQNTIRQASESFASLPAKVRDRFENDPALFLAFLSDPANKDEAQALGLLNKPGPDGLPPATPHPTPPTTTTMPAPEPPTS